MQWPTKALVPGASLEKASKKKDSSHIYEENAKLRLFVRAVSASAKLAKWFITLKSS